MPLTDTTKIYERRFNQMNNEGEFRDQMWNVLCSEFFQKYIAPDSTVLDLAAGYCVFINNIQAGHKIALDLNPDVKVKANSDVKVIVSPCTEMKEVETGSVDNIFISNFIEHITKEETDQMVKECYRVLKPHGQILIMGPNIRYTTKDFWMFWDHIHATDDRALTEFLEISGFGIKKVISQFLPYTVKSRLPKNITLIRIYLKFPLLWKLFGGQFFILAEKL